ncbi:hypothetical protein SAMN04487785_11720 [Dyella jiangningensis]|uniref:hypothetical protein n=1 Tax=Dyella sp. AtDHG13 TaxID=1938897 RepID=UPI00088D1706|nr:hypothetical protein [Dyella sp. AtDHG13]PXV59062.1 hypothetical protein BDW41_104106 [Dyella sp. AtDHG13]SDL27721.1 hypothetical protein SAMN04487785_11720 [Dyella jiangningensis]
MTRFRALLAATVWLTLAFSPFAFAANPMPPGASASPMPSAGDGQPSASEINSRADWNVDYPSQLAPQAATPKLPYRTLPTVVVTPTGAPEHPQP